MEETFRIRHRPEDVAGVLDDVEAFCATSGLTRETVLDVRLVAEEILTNIVKYAGHADWIELRLSLSSESARLEFRDQGAPFNPLDVPELAVGTAPRDIGGLGVHLVKSLVDEATYSREGRMNVLVLVKRFGSTV